MVRNKMKKYRVLENDWCVPAGIEVIKVETEIYVREGFYAVMDIKSIHLSNNNPYILPGDVLEEIK